MRYSLIQSFDKIIYLIYTEILEKEKAPDGSKDDNVFDIMQGVSINIFIKQNSKAKNTKFIIMIYTAKEKINTDFI